MAVLALALVCGCQTSDQKKQAKQVAAVRIHMESTPEDATVTQSITVVRADPITLTIEKEPILTEANLISAKTINDAGGFALQFKFDEISTGLLEQYTASNIGKHLAIFGQWGEKLKDGRWLAAPIITQRIHDGTLTFTPDMSRDEANQFILGLTNAVKKVQKGEWIH
ncbi:MAG TPA: hypothetical protein VGN23_13640 [Verrucomicrobiae bacterium]